MQVISLPYATDSDIMRFKRIIQFSSVKHGVVFYLGQKARRALHAAGLERGSGRPSQERINELDATYARLIVCLERERDEVDLDDGFYLCGRRVSDLATWYVSMDRAEDGVASRVEHVQQRMADEMGLSTMGLVRYCEKTEAVIGRRMRARGLLT